MVKKVRRGDQEVIVIIRWESEHHWKQWEKSEAHITAHKANLGPSRSRIYYQYREWFI